jgi:hypothetical protein
MSKFGTVEIGGLSHAPDVGRYEATLGELHQAVGSV